MAKSRREESDAEDRHHSSHHKSKWRVSRSIVSSSAQAEFIPWTSTDIRGKRRGFCRFLPQKVRTIRISYGSPPKIQNKKRDYLSKKIHKAAGPYFPEPNASKDSANETDEEPGSFIPELVHVHQGDESVDPEADKKEFKRRRALVLEEQQKRLQEATTGPSSVDEDSVELTSQERALVLKAMGGMETQSLVLAQK